jgi:hypothetical protein
VFAIGRGDPFSWRFLPSVTIRQALAEMADRHPECNPDSHPSIWFAGKERDYDATLDSLDGAGRISIGHALSRSSRGPPADGRIPQPAPERTPRPGPIPEPMEAPTRPLLGQFPQVRGERLADGCVVLQPPDKPRLPVDLEWPTPNRAVRAQAAQELRRDPGAFDRIVSFAQAHDPAVARRIADGRASICRALGVPDHH